MVWDKQQPQGSNTAARLIDDRVRENNAALETALDAEHDFTTGGGQTGRHRFGLGATAVRDAIAALQADGAIFFTQGGDVPADHAELTVYDESAAAWLLVSGRMLLEMLNAWRVAQSTHWITTAVSGGAVASDWSLGNFFAFEADADFTLSNPSNIPDPSAGPDWSGAGPGAGTWVYEITQDATGSRIMTLGSAFKTQFGNTLALTTTAGAVDLLYCTLRSDGNIHAELVRDSK